MGCFYAKDAVVVFSGGKLLKPILPVRLRLSFCTEWS